MYALISICPGLINRYIFSYRVTKLKISKLSPSDACHELEHLLDAHSIPCDRAALSKERLEMDIEAAILQRDAARDAASTTATGSRVSRAAAMNAAAALKAAAEEEKASDEDEVTDTEEEEQEQEENEDTDTEDEVEQPVTKKPRTETSTNTSTSRGTPSTSQDTSIG